MINILKWSFFSVCILILAGPIWELFWAARQIEQGVWEHLRSQLLMPSLKETLIFSIGSAFGASVIGTTWAFLSVFIAKRTFFFSVVMVVTLAIPTYVMGFSLLSFIDFAGPVQTFIMSTLGSEYYFEPRTRLNAIAIYSLAASPYVYFSVMIGLRTQVRSLIEASASLEQGFKKTFAKIIFPSVYPWILGGATLVALEATADFGFVDIFGVNTLSRLLYKSWGALFSFGGAARISLVLLAICFLILLLAKKLQRPILERSFSENYSIKDLFEVSKAIKITLYTLAVSGFVILNILPIGILVFHASNINLWQELSWKNSLFSTMIIGVAASLCVGFMMSILFFLFRSYASRSVKKSSVLNVFMIGYGLPGTLLAVGFYLFYSQVLGTETLNISNIGLMGMLILLYFVRFSGLMLRGLLNQETQNDSSILEVAKTLGSNTKNFFKIELPAYSSALILGFLLLFLEIIKELPAALMIKPFKEPTLALRVYQYSAESDWARASVFALILVFLVLVMSFLVKYIEGYRNKNVFRN